MVRGSLQSYTRPPPISSGYYKVDYQSNQAFKDALADGHTLEALFMYDSESQTGTEIKMFSSMQAGGTGFLLAKEKGEITFLPNLTSGGWQWSCKPPPPQGTATMLVGVWDEGTTESLLYLVNGELKGKLIPTEVKQ